MTLLKMFLLKKLIDIFHARIISWIMIHWWMIIATCNGISLQMKLTPDRFWMGAHSKQTYKFFTVSHCIYIHSHLHSSERNCEDHCCTKLLTWTQVQWCGSLLGCWCWDYFYFQVWSSQPVKTFFFVIEILDFWIYILNGDISCKTDFDFILSFRYHDEIYDSSNYYQCNIYLLYINYKYYYNCLHVNNNNNSTYW